MKSFLLSDLRDSLPTLPREQLVDIVVNAVQPDLIFLLGTLVQRTRSESIFSSTVPTPQYISDCFLLVLVPNFNNTPQHEWQDKIEAHCHAVMPVTTIVLETSTFIKWGQEGSKFAFTVSHSAVVLYDSNNMVESTIEETGHNGIGNDAEKIFMYGMTKAREFLAGSELYRIRKQHGMAAFMLHQATEQTLSALIEVGIGYHSNTHNIDRLLRYASLASGNLPGVFTRRTEREKQLFSLLQKAYVDPRYKADYKIGLEDLLFLTEKVKSILEIVQEAGRGFASASSLLQTGRCEKAIAS